MGQIFQLAKDFVDASPHDIEVLLERPDHPPRVAAVSIMDFQARRKDTPKSRRRELYELYLRRHDRIDTWDLVDRAAPHVVGGYLWDKSREPLYRLAVSPHWNERRTSIVSTWFFIRRHDLDDTFRIAETLATPMSWFRWQWAVGSVKPESGTSNDCAAISTATQQPCLVRLCATRSNSCRQTCVIITLASGTRLTVSWLLHHQRLPE